MYRIVLTLGLASACSFSGGGRAGGGGGGEPVDSAVPDTAIDADARTVLRITEINPAGTADLVELVAVTGGPLDGIELVEHTNSSYRFAFPAGYTIATGAVIVLHLGGSCTDTTADPTSCGSTPPFSAAWDFSMPGSFTYSGKVLELLHADDTSMDAVPFVESSGTPPSSYVAAVKLIQARAMYDVTRCVDDATTGMAADRYCRNISVLWDALSSDNTNSVTRIAGATPLAVPGSAAQWSAALPSTFGTY